MLANTAAVEAAEVLLSLLVEYVDTQYRWEDRLRSSSGKMQGKDILPLVNTCKAAGFKYKTLMDIIPGPFETTHEERFEILQELREWVDDAHGYSFLEFIGDEK